MITDKTNPTQTALETRVSGVGETLGRTLGALIDAVPGGPYGPAELGRTLGVDKVLASRLLKAAGNGDPLAVLHLSPGPEPLRRALKAAARRNVDPALVAEADQAVTAFETLIRREAGDRSALDAIISAWLPEARAEFELRRKQAAFKATSQLKGAAANVNLATVFLHPCDDETHVDIVWLFGMLGLRRLRPDASVKFATRRMSRDGAPRHPRTLDGESVEGLDGLRVDAFCSEPLVDLDVHQVGDVVHYTLAHDGFGPRSAADLLFAETNFGEIDRYIAPDAGRKAYVFAEIGTPVKALIFDVLVHDDVYPGSEPELAIYDTVLDGVADVNDRARDIDRLDLADSILTMGRGVHKFRSSEVPRYAEMLRHVFTRLSWDSRQFRGYRCRIDYPIYGSQVAMTFDAPAPPAPPVGLASD